jgi:hypothetical protein
MRLNKPKVETQVPKQTPEKPTLETKEFKNPEKARPDGFINVSGTLYRKG